MRAPSFQNKHNQLQADAQKTFPSGTFGAQFVAGIQENSCFRNASLMDVFLRLNPSLLVIPITTPDSCTDKTIR